MKIKNSAAMLLLLLFCAGFFTGCGRPETYGQIISNRQITKVEDIVRHPDAYKGRSVTVSGRITNECSTGCWFDLKDGEAVIYVNTESSGFAIPQKSGHRAVIEGDLLVENGKPKIIGKGIEVR